MHTQRLLIVIIVLQGLMLLGQWVGSLSLEPASAQVPNSGAQRAEMIRQLEALNEKTTDIQRLLDSGTLQVQVARPDEEE